MAEMCNKLLGCGLVLKWAIGKRRDDVTRLLLSCQYFQIVILETLYCSMFYHSNS